MKSFRKKLIRLIDVFAPMMILCFMLTVQLSRNYEEKKDIIPACREIDPSATADQVAMLDQKDCRPGATLLFEQAWHW